MFNLSSGNARSVVGVSCCIRCMLDGRWQDHRPLGDCTHCRREQSLQNRWMRPRNLFSPIQKWLVGYRPIFQWAQPSAKTNHPSHEKLHQPPFCIHQGPARRLSRSLKGQCVSKATSVNFVLDDDSPHHFMRKCRLHLLMRGASLFLLAD